MTATGALTTRSITFASAFLGEEAARAEQTRTTRAATVRANACPARRMATARCRRGAAFARMVDVSPQRFRRGRAVAPTVSARAGVVKRGTGIGMRTASELPPTYSEPAEVPAGCRSRPRATALPSEIAAIWTVRGACRRGQYFPGRLSFSMCRRESALPYLLWTSIAVEISNVSTRTPLLADVVAAHFPGAMG